MANFLFIFQYFLVNSRFHAIYWARVISLYKLSKKHILVSRNDHLTKYITARADHDNWLKRPTTKDENLRGPNGGDFHINAHGLPPTTNNESLDMSLAINSFQIKVLLRADEACRYMKTKQHSTAIVNLACQLKKNIKFRKP